MGNKNIIKRLLRENSADKLRYDIEHVDSYDGQDNMELGLYLNGEIIGLIQYVLYDGELSISDIIVRPEFRRKGFGSRMVQFIKQKHPEYNYVPGYKTDLGAKFKHKKVDGDLTSLNESTGNLIKRLLRENVRGKRIPKLILEHPQANAIKLALILEKRIRVGDNLTKKLSKINTKLSNNILRFLNSDNIKDNANVEYVDYDKKDEKLLTVGYTDMRGNPKENKLKVGKFLKYLGANLSDIKGYEVEELISHLKKGDIENFKVVDGDEILKVYHCENYDEGETMGSCMRHEFAQEFLSIYTDNPEQVKVLALVNPENGKIRGRALLWKLDNGETFMDRVYTTNNQYRSEFNSYAEEHGLKTGTPNDNVTLDNGGEYQQYPYMDTLKMYTPDTGVLSHDEGVLSLQDTHGGSSEGSWSDEMGEFIPDEDAMYVDHMEDYVYRDDVVMSYNEEEYLYYQSDDVVELTDGEHAGSYALKDETMRTYNNRVALVEEVYEIDEGRYEGEYATQEELSYTFDGKNVMHDDILELTNGNYSGDYAYKGDCYVITKEDGNGETSEGDIIHEDDLDDLEGSGAEYVSFDEYTD